MKEIFRGIIGMTITVGLFFVFNTLIQFYAPDMVLLTSAVKGFLYVTLFMGSIIVVKSGGELVYASCIKKSHSKAIKNDNSRRNALGQ